MIGCPTCVLIPLLLYPSHPHATPPPFTYACRCAPTAQVASQQGRYLGRLLSSVGLEAHQLRTDKTLTQAGFNTAVATKDDFHYVHKGSFAYVGGSNAIAQIPGSDSSTIDLKGADVYLAWRATYFSKLLGAKGRMSVSLDWLNSKLFGRDTSTFRPCIPERSWEIPPK